MFEVRVCKENHRFEIGEIYKVYAVRDNVLFLMYIEVKGVKQWGWYTADCFEPVTY